MGVTEGLRAPKLFTEGLRPPEEPRSERCLNCGTALAGPFCSQCGQRDIPPYPNVRELVTDAFWELSGWDGRFAATVRTLVRAPGALTIDFLEGRRARHISPLRLYLLASLLYFLVAAAVPRVNPRAGAVVQIDPGTAAGQVSVATQKAQAGALTPEQRDSALKQVQKAPRILRPILNRAVADPKGFQRSLIETMPRVLFALVPIFAAIVGLFYRHRKYPEHLYFALHLQAFVFVALTIGAVAKFSPVSAVSQVVSVLVVLWIIGYSVTAARRIYGGSVTATVAKGVGVVMLNSIAGIVALCIAIFVAALS